MNSKLKILNGVCMKFIECLNKDAKKKYFLFIRSRAVLIATCAKLLNTQYKFYGFNDDLRDTIN